MSLPTATKRRRVEERTALHNLLSFLGPESTLDVLVALEAKGVDVEGTVREMLREDTDPAKCKLFVRSLGWSTKPEQVREVFQQYGEIADLVVLEKDGKSKGFGFVTFGNAEEAARALEEPRKIIDGRETVCNLASRPDDRARGTTIGQPMQGQVVQGDSMSQQDQKEASRLFVRSLHWNTDQDSLRAAFEPFGTVVDCAVIIDKDTGKSKGYGFVTFGHPNAAKEALREPEKDIDGRKTYCNLASERKRAASSFMTAVDPTTAAYYQNLSSQLGGLQGVQQYLQQPGIQQQLQLQQLAALQAQQQVAPQSAAGAFPGQFPQPQQWPPAQLGASPQQNYALLLQQQQQLAAAVAQQQVSSPTIQSPSGVSAYQQQIPSQQSQQISQVYQPGGVGVSQPQFGQHRF